MTDKFSLNPIQKWYFDSHFDVTDEFNQSLLFKLKKRWIVNA